MDAEASKILDEYESFMRSWDAADKTIHARLSFVRGRIKAWGMDGFTEDSIRDWFAKSDFERWTRTTYYAHLNSFCEFMVAAGYLADNPMTEVRKPKAPKSLPRPLSEAEVARVLAKAEGPMRDWLLLALYAGLRAHEIAKIRGQDVAAEGLYVKGKGGVEATLPTHPALWEMAQRYPRHGYWFPGKDEGHIRANSVSCAVSRFFKDLGITGSIHRCRHAYATRLLRSGAHIRRVQVLMRHGSLQTTAIYTAVDEDELRDAIHQLPEVG